MNGDATWWDAATAVCTAKELETIRLQAKNLSLRQMSLAQGVTLSTIRSRLFNAHRKIEIALRKDAA